jgi:hypothetical protein
MGGRRVSAEMKTSGSMMAKVVTQGAVGGIDRTVPVGDEGGIT